MEVTLIDKMGTDLTVVNAARVSFGKKKKKFTDADAGLISYLARHNHWTPFGHCSVQFHIVAPVFVARQLVKHQVGLVWNEVSRRYVDTEPEFHDPEGWRLRAENKKQGSSDEVWESKSQWDSYSDPAVGYQNLCESAKRYYLHMVNDLKICPEQARMVLPQSMMTEWYWSGTLMAFARVCNLRCKPDTQLETRVVANQIDNLTKDLFPVSWEALRK
jgi:thymidylate synthase (FAD)